MSKDYYKLLNISKKSNQDEIKRAYRKLAMKFHPDKNKSKDAEEKFKSISEAYAILSDTGKKKSYDQFGEDGVNIGRSNSRRNVFTQNFTSRNGFNFENMDAHNIFTQVFGNNFKVGSQIKKDIVKRLECTLEEIYSGCVRKMKISKKIQDGQTNVITTVSNIITIDIKPGWKEGTKIRFKGAGDELNGQPTQDLVFIIIEKTHPKFSRDGDDLKYNITLSLTESLCGFTRVIESIDNQKLNIEMEKVVKQGNIHVVSNMGMPKKYGGRILFWE